MKKVMSLIALLILSTANAETMIYFTGIGCPHCARADPVIFNLFEEYPNLTIIEYEIYQNRINAPILNSYCEKLNLTQCGIPLAIISKNNYLIGDKPITEGIIKALEKDNETNFINLQTINLSNHEGNPKIWFKNGVLFEENNSWIIQWNGDLLEQSIPKEVFNKIKNFNYQTIKPKPMPLSGSSINFEKAAKLSIQSKINKVSDNLTLLKVFSLAIVDSINPCALSVLTFVLITIMTYDSKKKRKILLSGLMFSLSVFIMYLFYGLVLIKFFQLIQGLTAIRLTLYKGLGVIAIILGLLEIKDYFYYKPGGLFTEMPLFMRPIAKKLIKKITSPIGAFLIGLFVTVFLLPCTIGPYIITSGLLSANGIIKSIPYLIFYNLVFVSPMIGITLLIYLGVSKAKEVGSWRKRNVKLLHLIAGIIILILGLMMTISLL